MVPVQAAALVLKLPPTNTKAQWRSPLERRMLMPGEPVQLRGECGGGRYKKSMKITRSLVSVIDDDESVRESLPDLLKEFHFAVRTFSSAKEFLASDWVGQSSCLILDIAMPGMNGPGLQQELKRRLQEILIVFITAGRDEAVRARVLEQGAVECLFKPFSDTALLDALHAALRQDELSAPPAENIQ
jgi:FixJ family two-component response regulator